MNTPVRKRPSEKSCLSMQLSQAYHIYPSHDCDQHNSLISEADLPEKTIHSSWNEEQNSP